VTDVHVRLCVGGESYAFAVEHVLEVADLGEIAPVPGAGATVLGVRNLRGEVLPVFDFASVFGIEREGVAQHLLIVENDGIHAGLAIDDVLSVGVLPRPTEEAQSPLLHGALIDDGVLVGVVDVPRLFAGLAEEQR
jgi:purine-binding chemotaxis protein CheW